MIITLILYNINSYIQCNFNNDKHSSKNDKNNFNNTNVNYKNVSDININIIMRDFSTFVSERRHHSLINICREW